MDQRGMPHNSIKGYSLGMFRNTNSLIGSAIFSGVSNRLSTKFSASPLREWLRVTAKLVFLGVCRTTSKNGSAQKYGFTRCARINDHGAAKGSNTPGKVFSPGTPTDS